MTTSIDALDIRGDRAIERALPPVARRWGRGMWPQRVPAVGRRLLVRCEGGRRKGCFTKTVTFDLAKGGDHADIRRPIRQRRFNAGATLEIAISAPEAIAKVVRITARRNQRPRVAVRCLAPGQRAPHTFTVLAPNPNQVSHVRLHRTR